VFQKSSDRESTAWVRAILTACIGGPRLKSAAIPEAIAGPANPGHARPLRNPGGKRSSLGHILDASRRSPQVMPADLADLANWRIREILA